MSVAAKACIRLELFEDALHMAGDEARFDIAMHLCERKEYDAALRYAPIRLQVAKALYGDGQVARARRLVEEETAAVEQIDEVEARLHAWMHSLWYVPAGLEEVRTHILEHALPLLPKAGWQSHLVESFTGVLLEKGDWDTCLQTLELLKAQPVSNGYESACSSLAGSLLSKDCDASRARDLLARAWTPDSTLKPHERDALRWVPRQSKIKRQWLETRYPGINVIGADEAGRDAIRSIRPEISFGMDTWMRPFRYHAHSAQSSAMKRCVG